MPLQRRIPKRGFTPRKRTEYQVVNVRDLTRLDSVEVTPGSLREHGLIRSLKKPVKILGAGDVDRAYQARVHAISDGARAKIESQGGSVALIGEETQS